MLEGTSVKGTRPEGANTEAEASRQVREMFTQIAPRYDLLNHLLSLQINRVWRSRAAKRLSSVLRASTSRVVLDLCCGTGDLAAEVAVDLQARVVGVDFAHPMLVRAKKKTGSGEMLRQRQPIRYAEADALHLPFADASFDAVATAFGFRNLANYETGLKEIHRVLKLGGTLEILEFTEPPAGLVGDLYRWYFRKVLPRVGRLVSGDGSAYNYLPASVSSFFRPAELAALMESVGYQSIDFEVWTFGAVALHTGKKGQ
jgi:demethylmenaquinone methyltransferase / 2-methoxy-6-polyprenyl-1,4-benzoquinol methylase